MHFKEQTNEKAMIALTEEEASQLLSTIKAHGETLGDSCEELGEALEQAGVKPPAEPDHIRYEFAGPNE